MMIAPDLKRTLKAITTMMARMLANETGEKLNITRKNLTDEAKKTST